MGDSITFGYGTSGKSKTWPSLVQGMLGDDFTVVNLGLNGREMMKSCGSPYWNEPQFKTALSSNADCVILMLGTNDS